MSAPAHVIYNVASETFFLQSRLLFDTFWFEILKMHINYRIEVMTAELAGFELEDHYFN